jgi:flagellar export protein FliJ
MSQGAGRSGGLGVVIRLAGDAERLAAERLRDAQQRLAANERQLEAVQSYLAEYTQRAASANAQTARRVLDERRFLAQLQATVAAQLRVVDQERRHVETARGQWLTARRKCDTLEAMAAERVRRAEQRAERREQQLLDDRPLRNRPGAPG